METSDLFFNKLSAEQKFVIGSGSFEITAHRFAKYPVVILADFREDFYSYLDQESQSEIDLSNPENNAFCHALIVLQDLSKYIVDKDLKVEDDLLETYLENDSYTDEGDAALFRLFKSAGFTKEEIEAYYNDEAVKNLPDIDRFMIKRSVTILERVYRDDE
tara:strand:+ start:2130 stop:2612 length:483 start_codon:yes stop_codon:yes gene_type:complete